MKTAKALVEDTKTLVAGAASSQEQLAVAAQNAVTTIVQLSDVVKNGAASLGSQNQEAQVKNQTFIRFIFYFENMSHLIFDQTLLIAVVLISVLTIRLC